MTATLDERAGDVPKRYDSSIDAHTAIRQAELEDEAEYAARTVPDVPEASLLSALSALWTYPLHGIDGVFDQLEDFCADESQLLCKPDLERLRELLDDFRHTTEEIVGADALQLEYTRLFIGSFRMYAAPYASFYLDSENQVYGPTAAEIENLYAQFGLEIKQDEHDMPDHLRFLLAFMSLLATSYESTGKADFALAYQDFKEEYVDSWLPDLRANVQKYAEYDYFKALLDFTIEHL
ncbi:MAG: molecular chaperone TorD family protein [Coriobacteriia bacterium]|nr:molecular chaperone TorD family protein [Coriobacteriia bacterium]